MLIGTLEEALERAVDEARVALLQLLVREAELVERAGAEILGEYIAFFDQLEDEGIALRVLEIDGKALLVAVEDRIEAGAGVVQAPRIVAFERLHLDHFGAEV